MVTLFHVLLLQGVQECHFQSRLATRRLNQNRPHRNFCSTIARTLIGRKDGISILKMSCVGKCTCYLCDGTKYLGLVVRKLDSAIKCIVIILNLAMLFPCIDLLFMVWSLKIRIITYLLRRRETEFCGLESAVVERAVEGPQNSLSSRGLSK